MSALGRRTRQGGPVDMYTHEYIKHIYKYIYIYIYVALQEAECHGGNSDGRGAGTALRKYIDMNTHKLMHIDTSISE